MLTKKTLTYIRFLHHGTFSIEENTIAVKSRNIKNLQIPETCFAFYFFDQVVINDDEESEAFLGKEKNVSGRYFYGGKILTPEEILEIPQPNSLQQLMDSTKCKTIRTPFNKHQLFDEKTDVLLERK